MSAIRLTWNEANRRWHSEKHRIDFAEAERFEWQTALVLPSPSRGEMRYRALGRIGDRLHALVFTSDAPDHVHVISLRPASRKERRGYAQASKSPAR